MANATIKYGEGKWAIGENVALAYNDTNDRYKPLPFNFTRGSEATFINRQGLIESTNVIGSEEILNSDFSNGTSEWAQGVEVTSFTVTNGIATIQGNADSFNTRINQVLTVVIGKTYKITAKIKSNDGGKYRFRIFDGNYIDIVGDTNSEFQTTTYYHTAITTSLNTYLSSWYENGTTDFSIDNVSVKEVTYATNTPRIDFSNDSEGALLLEPQRKNELSYSSDFNDAYWAKIDSTIEGGKLSPSGEYNAHRFIPNTVDTVHVTYNAGNTMVGGSDNTYSLFVKYQGVQWCRLFCQFGGASYNTWFDALNGVVGSNDSSVTATIKDYGNGWFRITQSRSSDSDLGRYRFYLADSDGGFGFAGDGVIGMDIYGAQCEEGSYATSLIPTNGTPSTRLGEVCTDSGNTSFINSEEGVLYAEISGLATDENKCISISSGSLNDSVNIFHLADNNTVRALILSGSSTQASIDVALDITSNHKIAIKWKANDFALWVDGVEVGIDSNGNAPTGLNNVSFNQGGGTSDFYGNTKSVQVFSEALSDAELQTLTTI